MEACRALYEYQAAEADELTIKEGDLVQVTKKLDDGWWFGVIEDGLPRCGLFPGSYVAPAHELPPATELPPPAELAPSADLAPAGEMAPPADAAAPAEPEEPAEPAEPEEPAAVELALPSPAGDGDAAGGSEDPAFAAADASAGSTASVAAPDLASPAPTPPADAELVAARDLVVKLGSNQDEALSLIAELEHRAATAEKALADERRAAAAFREATTASLSVLEQTLTRALAPLGGIVVEGPKDAGDDDAAFWEQSGDARSDDAVARRLAAEIGRRLKTGTLGRKTVAWDDFCDAVNAAAPPGRDRADAARDAAPFASPAVLRTPALAQSQSQPALHHPHHLKAAALAVEAAHHHHHRPQEPPAPPPQQLHHGHADQHSLRAAALAVEAANHAPHYAAPTTSSLLHHDHDPHHRGHHGAPPHHEPPYHHYEPPRHHIEPPHHSPPRHYAPDYDAPRHHEHARHPEPMRHPEPARHSGEHARHHQEPPRHQEPSPHHVARHSGEHARHSGEPARRPEQPPPPRESPREPQPPADERLSKILDRFASPLRGLFRDYATARGPGGRPGQVVSPADVLRLCRDHRVSPTLLSHQEVTSVTRGALGDGETGGLDGPGLRKCLERLAVAAYATVPTMGVGDKVEALFLHMGLAEKLIEATRAAPRRARSAPRADEEHPAALPPVVQPGGRPQIAPRPDVVDASAAVAPTRIRGSGDYYYPGGDVVQKIPHHAWNSPKPKGGDPFSSPHRKAPAASPTHKHHHAASPAERAHAERGHVYHPHHGGHP